MHRLVCIAVQSNAVNSDAISREYLDDGDTIIPFSLSLSSSLEHPRSSFRWTLALVFGTWKKEVLVVAKEMRSNLKLRLNISRRTNLTI